MALVWSYIQASRTTWSGNMVRLNNYSYNCSSWPYVLSRKNETGGGEWVHPKGVNNMVVLGFAVESTWSAQGGPFLSSYAWVGCSGHVGALFQAVKLYFRSVGAIIGQEPWFVRKWVWFESWICTGWLQWHLCEARNMVRLGVYRLKGTSIEKNSAVNWLKASYLDCIVKWY